MIGPVLVFTLLAQGTAASPAQTPASQPPAATAQAPDAQPWTPPGVYQTAPGLISPVVLKEEKPKYTEAAMKERIQGSVEVKAIVLADGTVGEVRVVRSLDKVFGLDEQAIAAVKNWRFAAGKKDGVAVPVMVSIELTFTLRSGPGKH